MAGIKITCAYCLFCDTCDDKSEMNHNCSFECDDYYPATEDVYDEIIEDKIEDRIEQGRILYNAEFQEYVRLFYGESE